MPEVIYYVAMSLDGYIATPDGGVDWLAPFQSGEEDYGYGAFYASVGALLMGSRTYEQILSFGSWPYEGKPCWVFSGRPLDSVQAGVTLTSKKPRDVLADLEQGGTERVWLVGGAALAASFRSLGLISEVLVSVIPTILGAGIALFKPGGPKEERLALVESKQFDSGLIQLRYRKSNAA